MLSPRALCGIKIHATFRVGEQWGLYIFCKTHCEKRTPTHRVEELLWTMMCTPVTLQKF
jgi:hypothetical protein